MKAKTAKINLSNMVATVEVLIIGGGVIGSSIAYHAARLGRTVLVVERKAGAVRPAASSSGLLGERGRNTSAETPSG